MIFESIYNQQQPNKEDFKLPNGECNYVAYQEACDKYEMSSHHYKKIWRDEKTGKHLFTEDLQFTEGPYYHENGQGDWTSTYKAHFPINTWETPEEVFRIKQKADRENKPFHHEIIPIEDEMKSFSPVIQQKWENTLTEIKKKESIDIYQQVSSAQKEFLVKARKWQNLEDIKAKVEKRNQDPVWISMKLMARAMVKSQQKSMARALIKEYLNHTKV